MQMRSFFWILILTGMAPSCLAQSLPTTVGETLDGERIVLADAVRGRTTVLVASFSKEAGTGSDDWSKAVEADPALAGVAVYRAAMLEQAPGLVRGFIKSALRKQLSATAQRHFAILARDERQWREFFGVTTDKDPYIVLLDASGQVRWHGHGGARELEPMLKAALR